jgi:hypothetical protein
MQISAAIFIALRAMSSASKSVFSASASAADCA